MFCVLFIRFSGILRLPLFHCILVLFSCVVVVVVVVAAAVVVFACVVFVCCLCVLPCFSFVCVCVYVYLYCSFRVLGMCSMFLCMVYLTCDVLFLCL